jgi:uncharacterized protein
MATIAGRTFPARRTAQGWVAWIILSLPVLGIGSFLYVSSHKVVKPNISVLQAVDANDVDAIDAHAKTGTDLNNLDANGHSALYRAIDDEQFETGVKLIECGANPNAERAGLETPLMRAASKGNAQTVRALLTAGAKANEQLDNGMTALYAATMNGQPEVASLLVDAGANPNPKVTPNVTSPLCVASWRGDSESVRILLRAGANMSAQGCGHETPLQLASSRGHHEVVDLLSNFGQKS